tara:strand:+ start:1922 stop:3286 length:1365 start_codon:yes stop_codon:yes gene_type:complete
MVINLVGLTESMIGPNTPNLFNLKNRGDFSRIETITPAVTCSVQATFLTGTMPDKHGIVANGWFDRQYNEVWFWRQSNKLIQSEKVWEAAKKLNNKFTCANMFWWYNMATSVDFAVTPRPMYPADGRKIPDCHTKPAELRHTLTEKLGPFPLFNYWGPMTSIDSSRWITEASKIVWHSKNPTLMLVYLPYLDYNLQRHGPQSPEISDDISLVDQLCGELIDMASNDNANVIVLSEYAVTPVDKPIHINRALRQSGLLQVRYELGLDQLDLANSRAFAVSDHQISHIYVNISEDIPGVKKLIESLDGVDEVLSDEGSKQNYNLNHGRSGDLIALAKPNAWFTYYFWMNDHCAPDYARTVDIHRKPGFDPVELFYDSTIRGLPIAIAWKLFKKKLGFRQLLDVIPLNAELIKGSHGLVHHSEQHSPVVITSEQNQLSNVTPACDIKQLILDHVFVS